MKNAIMPSVVALLLSVFLSACPLGDSVSTVELSSGLTAQTLKGNAFYGLNLRAGRDGSHLLYYDEEKYKIIYVYIEGNRWVFKRNWDFGDCGFGVGHDITLDSLGKVHISCSLSDGSDEDLGYVNNVAGLWLTSRPNAVGGSSVGMGSKIVVDRLGGVCIVHHRWNDGALLCTTRVGPIWVTVKLSDDAGYPNGMLVDSDNNIHVFAGSKHFTRVGVNWEEEDLPDWCYGGSCAIDDQDNLYVLDGGTLWSKPAGGDWQRQDISDEMFGESAYVYPGTTENSLAVDKDGYLHIAFMTDDYDYEVGEGEFSFYYGSNRSGNWRAVEIDSRIGENIPWDMLAIAARAGDDIRYAYQVDDNLYYLAFDPAQLW